jgi:ankyrin repeat protein
MGRRQQRTDKKGKTTQQLTACAGASLIALALYLALSGIPGEDLFNAAKTGKADEVRRLLADGADPDLQNLWWNEKTQRSITDLPTAMMAAVQGRHVETVRVLIEGGANLDARNLNGKSALDYAVSAGRPETIVMLLEAGAAFDTQNIKGFSPLMDAAYGGHAEAVRLLLDKGANPDLGVYASDPASGEGRGGETALMLAVDKDRPEDRLEIVKMLLGAGAQIDLQDHTGRTALMHAKLFGHESHVQALLDAGADTSALDSCVASGVEALGP